VFAFVDCLKPYCSTYGFDALHPWGRKMATVAGSTADMPPRSSQSVFQRLRADLGQHLKYSYQRIHNPKTIAYHGISIPMHATSYISRVRKALYRGDYEAPEIAMIRTVIRPDDIVLEIGAGIGVVSSIIATQLASPSNLWSYEANPALIDSIYAISEENSLDFHVINSAISLEDGEEKFYFDSHFESSSLLNRQRGAHETKVQTASFSRILAELKPSVIVMDVEGAEERLLAMPMPNSVRTICGEAHPHIIGDRAVSRLMANLIDQGFDYKMDLSYGRGFTFSRS
jgi:FkbM family methyltransferase